MKDYLVCIDSDGCAVDSMECKHRQCFGPCMVETWHLEPWKDAILNRWNDINLYTMTRGINRFLGLQKMLAEVNETCTPIDGLTEYSRWCGTTATYSNAEVQRQIDSGAHPIFTQVLQWSNNVNRSIAALSPEIRPFPGVGEALKLLKTRADIAIVSSANPQAVQEEWTRFGFLPLVDYVMAQDAGTKADCIGRMLRTGYRPEHVLMVGDAPGDLQAAQANGVYYYPILAGHEAESWQELTAKAFPHFLSGAYGADQGCLIRRFLNNLGSGQT